MTIFVGLFLYVKLLCWHMQMFQEERVCLHVHRQSFFTGNWKSKMTGKILLLWMYVPLLIENIETPGWIRLIVGLCRVVSNTIGSWVKITSVLIIVLLLLGNYPFIDKRRTLCDSDCSSLTYFMNTMMMTGGYWLQVSCRSENTDSNNKT